MKKTELLAPAGDMECLRTACRYGADAVYIGGPFMQLRAERVSFDRGTIIKAADYMHGLNKKLYVTVNCFAGNDEIEPIGEYARFLADVGVDAVIVADIGALAAVKKAAPDIAVHISTQANCTNYMAAKVYADMGAQRVIPARELTLAEISGLAAAKPAQLELETFIHGAMCMSYSGRCLISSFLTGRSANRGECTQPCRWSYFLTEQNRPGEYFELIESGGASAILSSHDLCCIDILDEIVSAGVVSLKIEGRMKTPFYVAAVTNAYRCALDKTADQQVLRKELDAVSHRPYSTGFYHGQLAADCHNDGGYIQKYKFAAVVQSCENGFITVEQRNRFRRGDVLEAVVPGVFGLSFTADAIFDSEGRAVDAASHPQEIMRLTCPLKLSPGDILRVKTDIGDNRK